MNNNKLAFLLILLFGFSSFCMDETQPLSQEQAEEAIETALGEEEQKINTTTSSAQNEGNSKGSGNSTSFLVTETSAFQHGASSEEMSSDEIREDEDLPALHFFLRDRELIDVGTIIEELKEAKEKNKNFQRPGFLLHGPAGNGKVTIARIISKKSGWKLVAIESRKLIEGEYFNEEELLNSEQREQRFELILKNLGKKAKSKSDKKIKNAIKALLCAISAEPIILFLHNIEVLFDEKNSTVLNMFMESFRDFKSLGLMFLIGSTRHSNIVTDRLTTELFNPIHVQLPDAQKRAAILGYYFKKYNIWIRPASPRGRLGNLAMRTEGTKKYIQFLKNKPKERILDNELFIILVGITKNFSGSDLEEIASRTNFAINANLPRVDEVWSIDILKDSYCWDDFGPGLHSFHRLLLSPLELLVLPLNRYCDDGPHEYSFSLVKIIKERRQWEKTMTLSQKISKKRRCWNVIKLIGRSGEEIIYGISAFVLNKGTDYGSKVLSNSLSGIINCGSGTVGLTAYLIKPLADGAQAVSSGACKLGAHLMKPAVDAVVENTREEIKRLALEKSKKLYSSKDKEDKGKEKVEEGEKEDSAS